VTETAEHLELLKQGTAAWNRWKAGHPLIRANLSGADLSGLTLREAYLNAAIFSAANLDEADLSRAVLTDAHLNATFLRGAKLAGALLRDASLFQANLRGADLSGADLRSANLAQAELSRANLGRADLRRANLRGADLRGASLVEANLGGADLGGASLAAASLRGATLSAADLAGAELSGVDLEDATVGWTRFGDADLSVVAGLDTVVHLGPSTIGIDTVYRSQGKIPEAFLRGAGVPAIFLTYMASLVGQPFEFFACFIGCSAQDRRFCDRLHADLQAKRIRTWLLPDDEAPGAAALQEVDRGIKIYDKLVVVCSASSLRSEAVLRELERALDREEAGREVLFPVLLDDYLTDGWRHARRADVLRRVVGDFRGWERSADTYDAALEGLLEALKGTD
jgi:uncharacterized protein YjbI with pentapeptide repeats